MEWTKSYTLFKLEFTTNLKIKIKNIKWIFTIKEKNPTPLMGFTTHLGKQKQSINHVSEYLKYINIQSIYLFIPKAMG